MGWRTIAARATRIGVLALVAACASSSSSTVTGGAQTAGDSVPAQGTVVTVLNTSPSATTITVYMKPEIGVDTPLGTVEAGESRTFAYDGLPGFYQIRTVGSNGERTSTRFQLFRNSSIRWDMSGGGRVVVGRRDQI